MEDESPSGRRIATYESRPLGEWDRILVLLEEFRALYSLLSFRLSAVDSRLPFAGGALGAVLGSFRALPPDTKLVVLLMMPPALTWLMRSTVNHSRSKEDVLRRIDEIERQVNQISGEELLAFQSRHPGRRKAVSGRSGSSTVFAVLACCLAGLASCAFLLSTTDVHFASARIWWSYWSLLALSALDLLHSVFRLRHYRYQKAPPESCPLFAGRRLD